MTKENVVPIVGFIDMGSSLFRKYMSGKYISCLENAGGKVQILKSTSELEILQEYVNVCDGFLFPGGADIQPALYGENNTSACGKPNLERDEMEFPLLRLAIQSGKPILCVCRGMQMLNIVQGGTLFQDIKAMQKYPHSCFLKRSKQIHEIEIKTETKLFDIYQTSAYKVNSIHHQAVKEIGKDIIVSALSTDGQIEGIELSNHPFCVGVQWHPEHLAKNFKAEQNLFDKFIEKMI